MKVLYVFGQITYQFLPFYQFICLILLERFSLSDYFIIFFMTSPAKCRKDKSFKQIEFVSSRIGLQWSIHS